METLVSEITRTEFVPSMKIFIFLTILSFLPMLIFMATSFVRTVVTFSFLKSALGIQQSIPNQVLLGLAIALTVFIMSPVIRDVNNNAIQPYMEEKITNEEFLKETVKPMREFLLKQTRETDLKLFVETCGLEEEKLTKENIPLYVVIPAFAISELKTAFQIGFIIYLPFMLIDLVVASGLMSMGMFMLPPTMISTAIKLLIFVMADGWNLLVSALIKSFM